MSKHIPRRAIILVIGIALFIIGAYLIHDLILKFLKFSIGLFLILISLPLIFGSKIWIRRPKRAKVIKTVRRE